MKKFKISKIISIICSIIGMILSLRGLISGLQSIVAGASGPGIGAEELDKLGLLFIVPSIIVSLIALIMTFFDFLITIDKIKNGLPYSHVSSLLKIGVIVLLIPIIVHECVREIKFGDSYLRIVLVIIVELIIFTIPAVLNTIKLKKQKKRMQ